nr:MAG TPA: hypothetical protein [Caudoviricetes sp.]
MSLRGAKRRGNLAVQVLTADRLRRIRPGEGRSRSARCFRK